MSVAVGVRPRLTHRGAVALMIAVTLMWSIAGVVTRQLDAARSFEITFWRSAFNALALVLLLAAVRGPRALAQSFATLAAPTRAGRVLWLSGLCWCVMYTAFMVALSLTSVANVLVTMALAPLATALVARAALKHRLAPRTWGAVVVAGIGIAWMQAGRFSGGDARDAVGTLIALAVPIAAAVNWTTLQALRRTSAPAGAAASALGPDMLVAVLLGALLSAALTLPLALPFAASAPDLGWLALLGVVQLAVPCLLAVTAARVLSAPEVALLGLLEVVFGVAWAWLGAGEAPGPATLGGGLLVVGALAANETAELLRRS